MELNSWTGFFLIMASAVLIIRKFLIWNLDSDFAVSAKIGEFREIYRKIFGFARYRYRNRGSGASMTFREWVLEEAADGHK